MAHLVIRNADTFQLDNGTATTVDVPHAFGAMVRSIAATEEAAKRVLDGRSIAVNVSSKVALIKYLRASILIGGHTLGLKDAKDIVDHYYNTALTTNSY